MSADRGQYDHLQPALKLIDAGRFGEALFMLKAAADADPGNAEIHRLAGECLASLGEHEAAAGAFHQAVRIRPDWPAPYLGAAGVQASRGDAYAAMQSLLHVLDFAPRHLQATQQLAGLLARLTPNTYLAALEPALLQCFAHPDIDPTPLTALCGQQLRLGLAERQGSGAMSDDGIEYLDNMDLWHCYLSRVINTDPELEALLTNLRRHLLLNTQIEALRETPVRLIAALAQQCFLNEYVFECSEIESDRIAELGRPRIEMQDESAAVCFALGCLYRAPVPDAETQDLAVSLSEKFPWISNLCRVTVLEPREEARLARTIPTLHEVSDETSLQVQAQYEANPYPRWHTAPTSSKVPLLEIFRHKFSLRREVDRGANRAQLLVAGCGTGFEPVDIACRDSNIDITAIDLSRRSLAYAKRKAQLLKCTNIDFLQGDILDLSAIDRKFDVIVCTGVLHHMADPLAGWSILRDRLADTGMMRIGVYSVYARRRIRKARELIDARGLSAEAVDIRQFRQWLLNEAGDADLAALQSSEDLYSMSGCRDLLFHVQERQFTLPQIEEALARLGLRFCGFEPPDASLLRQFSQANPDSDALLDLGSWDRFEQANPDIFAGMYQFWCEPE